MRPSGDGVRRAAGTGPIAASRASTVFRRSFASADARGIAWASIIDDR
jgi:hypothetical protein